MIDENEVEFEVIDQSSAEGIVVILFKQRGRSKYDFITNEEITEGEFGLWIWSKDDETVRDWYISLESVDKVTQDTLWSEIYENRILKCCMCQEYKPTHRINDTFHIHKHCLHILRGQVESVTNNINSKILTHEI